MNPSFTMHCVLQKSRLWAAPWLFVLGGCANMAGLTPQSHSIDPQALKVGKTIAETKTTIAWPDETWWEAYHDPQLNALMAKALAESPTLHVAQARVALSKAIAESQHAATLPNATADASAVGQRFTELQFIPPPSAGNWDWDNKVAGALSYDLDLWGKKKNLWIGAIDEVKATVSESHEVKLALATAVMRQYIRLNLQFAERDIAEKRAALIRHRIDIAKRGVAAGLMTQMQLLETQTALPMALAQIEHVDEQIALSRNQLAALSGQGPGAGDDITRPTLTLNAPIGLPDRLPANLVGRRPDVIAHRWHVEAAGLSIESAKAAFYPDINLIAFAGFQALGFGQLISGASAIAGVGPAFSLPIFDGGRRRGNLSAKDALYDIAVEQYNETVIHALQDVADQLVILESNAKQRAQADEAMALATRAHALAQKSYQVGLENYLHVLDTQAVLTNHEEAIARLYAVRLDAHATLMQALGGGVEDIPIAVTTTPVEKSGE